VPALDRIRRARPRPAAAPEERCELCAEPIGDEHGHLVDVQSRSLRCVCRGCHILFTADGAGGNRLRSVPDRYAAFPELELSVVHWETFQIPVSVAFFFENSSLGRTVALYPSPAGATESLLPLDAWIELTATHPELTALVPDVEALLVRADRDGRVECYIVPIDACYELVGRLRTSWRGFDGGPDARDELTAFFARVRERAASASGGRPSLPEATS
jgi:hypothetical protein